MSLEPTASPVLFTPSHPWVVENDYTSLLNVVGWFGITVIVLTVFTRLGTRQAISRTVGFDDIAIVIATFISIGETVAMSIGVKNGLGCLTGKETVEQLDAQQKASHSYHLLVVYCC
ncbi:hypothetical protein DPSP01_013618 [Paraphaeosphaeria sporulosa]|uniref:Uncharacterized protein n=1 Tax=Paraphaeosphaeria sporulosa TaxID=1460663 RepID=A0A177C279_9PLEO|nr:uncharacterized protein CC84DRAFT_1180708 [Paraphaeosphaeria sporulosa]OAG00740.1 hypothetical protein CC84DRAFT_1180708 [Paraphaeosphaeria sporulosa]